MEIRGWVSEINFKNSSEWLIIEYLLEWWCNACSDWLKNWGDFCINQKNVLWCHMYLYDVKSWIHNPAFIWVRINSQFLCWSEWKLNDKNFFGWSRYQPIKEQKTFATMRYVHWCSFPSFFGWTKNILDSYLNKIF